MTITSEPISSTTAVRNGETRTTAVARVLPDDVLARARQRAAHHDSTNTFFHDDFEELRALGYLAAAVPPEFGGWGLSLAELGEQQRRLARHSASVALA